MSEEKIEFLDFDEALRLVAAIQEEEDIHESNRRILTVYNHHDQEVCWFDFDEVMEAVGDVPAGERKESVERYILTHIPRWALDSE